MHHIVRHSVCHGVSKTHSTFAWAPQVMQKRALDNPKITVLWDSVVEEAYGNERVRVVLTALAHLTLFAGAPVLTPLNSRSAWTQCTQAPTHAHANINAHWYTFPHRSA